MHVCYNPRAIISSIFVGFSFVLIIILIWSCGVPHASGAQGYLDYMPGAIEPCPSHYRCGAASIDQVKLENDLYANLRESEKYAVPELMGTDQYGVLAKQSEPTGCMIARAKVAHETPLPEGMYTPENDFERQLLLRQKN
jgi:hypothetical protein